MRTYEGPVDNASIDIEFENFQLKGSTIDFECVLHLHAGVPPWRCTSKASLGVDGWFRTGEINPPQAWETWKGWFHPCKFEFRVGLLEDGNLYIYGDLLYQPKGRIDFSARLQESGSG